MPKENCILKPTEQDRFAAAFELLTHFAKIAQHFCWILSDASVNFFFLFSFFSIFTCGFVVGAAIMLHLFAELLREPISNLSVTLPTSGCQQN